MKKRAKGLVRREARLLYILEALVLPMQNMVLPFRNDQEVKGATGH